MEGGNPAAPHTQRDRNRYRGRDGQEWLPVSVFRSFPHFVYSLSPLFLHSFFCLLLFWEEQNRTDFSRSHLPGLRVGNRAGHKEPSSRLWPPVCSLALTMPPLTRRAPRFMYLNHYQEFSFRGIRQESVLNQRLLSASQESGAATPFVCGFHTNPMREVCYSHFRAGGLGLRLEDNPRHSARCLAELTGARE